MGVAGPTIPRWDPSLCWPLCSPPSSAGVWGPLRYSCLRLEIHGQKGWSNTKGLLTIQPSTSFLVSDACSIGMFLYQDCLICLFNRHARTHV